MATGLSAVSWRITFKNLNKETNSKNPVRQKNGSYKHQPGILEL